ncbi:MAG: hypothetical protein ACE5SW_02250 [Nitrososphaeraceae archaeon]
MTASRVTYNSILANIMIVLFTTIILLSFLPDSYSESAITILEQKIYKNSNGDWNLIGSLRNQAETPVELIYDINSLNLSKSQSDIFKSISFANVVYPDSVVPFKFVSTDRELLKHFPEMLKIKKVDKPLFFDISHEYSNLAEGNEKILSGKIKNTGSTIIKDIVVYASVHAKNATQLDSAKSDVIPTLRPGEEKSYKIIPDPLIRSDVYYYSCAGLDINSPITTLDTGDGFLAFDLQSASLVSNFGYESSSDSIIFTIKPYNPNGGDAVLKIPQSKSGQKVDVILDGKIHSKAGVDMDGKTITMNIPIPPNEHDIVISGVKNGI